MVKRLIVTELLVGLALDDGRKYELKTNLEKLPALLKRFLDAWKMMQTDLISELGSVVVKKRGDWMLDSPCFQRLVLAVMKT